MRKVAEQALNQRAHNLPADQYHIKDKVWLDAKNLSLPHASTKLAPKHHGPFQILQQISPVTYWLQLPLAWRIHDVFHTSLLSPYKEMEEKGVNFPWLPGELVEGIEEYGVEEVINHHYHRCGCKLQYLIKWLGYPVSENTWESAEDVFAPKLVTAYHKKHPLEYKETQKS